MTYDNYLRSFGIHPCSVVFADKKTDKYGTKYIITFEHTGTQARIDAKFELGADGKIPPESFSRTTITNILKAVGVDTPRDLIGKSLLVLVEPFEWSKGGKSGTMWSPKKFWNIKYKEYLGETTPVHEAVDQPSDAIDW